MMTFRQLILTASNQPQGSTLKTHLNNLQAIKYVSIIDSVNLVSEDKVLAIVDTPVTLLSIAKVPSKDIKIIADSSDLTLGGSKNGLKIS